MIFGVKPISKRNRSIPIDVILCNLKIMIQKNLKYHASINRLAMKLIIFNILDLFSRKRDCFKRGEKKTCIHDEIGSVVWVYNYLLKLIQRYGLRCGSQIDQLANVNNVSKCSTVQLLNMERLFNFILVLFLFFCHYWLLRSPFLKRLLVILHA